MAARKKSTPDLAPQTDPKSPLDVRAFLSAAGPVLTALEEDLLARADASKGLTKTLKARHAEEQKHNRTADNYEVWRRNFVEQLAAAWFLSAVFVRTLEDRGLLERNRIAGEGALDSQKAFFAMAPSLSERDYLLTVFKELTHLPAATALFDSAHNPVWQLGPSADACQKLLALFRTPSPETPAFRFGGDSRFLGDLYQDLNENVRARYALLQTPHFVESFILDQTLEPAIARFGLADTTLIDPTCGSGHFVLGAFERLLNHRLAKHPGVDIRQSAAKALDAIAGADINPYAVAIARFRLTLAFVEKTSIRRLKDAPKLPLHLAVADSLLHNPQKGIEKIRVGQEQQMLLGDAPGADLEAFELGYTTFEDQRAIDDVLGKRYCAIVGNPPYITVKDSGLREIYRKMYRNSAAGKYSVAAPFTERFFHLGRHKAFVGMITANSFMKREFGKPLIEKYLPTVNLTAVINTSGAYIPGHGTPTVLLFGTAEKPVEHAPIATVLANRGEPATPDDPAKGLVWQSIADHFADVGFENEYVSVANTERSTLAKHPWSLGGGGASELKELLEERAEKTLGDCVSTIGFMSITGEDDIFARPKGCWRRMNVEGDWIHDFCIGEEIRDWRSAFENEAFFPYKEAALQAPEKYPNAAKALWSHRRILENRPTFGGAKYRDVGRPWFCYHQVPLERLKIPLSIAFAFVATRNHFVLDRGRKVFNQSAPILKLPEFATESDHYALLAYLNSSTACFWMKQVVYPVGGDQMGDGGRLSTTKWEDRYQYSGTALKPMPLPAGYLDLVPFGRTIESLAAKRAACAQQALDGAIDDATFRELDATYLRELTGLQESLDWTVYRLFGLTKESSLETNENEEPGWRAFEHAHRGQNREADAGWYQRGGYSNEPRQPSTLQAARMEAAKKIREIEIIETLDFKRWWRPADALGIIARGQRDRALNETESKLRDRSMPATLRSLVGATASECATLVAGENVPFLAAYRYTDAGLEKYAAWEQTWELQRREDRGEKMGEIPVPPKYDSKDFRSPSYWSLRGKLDVPKERFIAYPGCESDEDHEPVYGWAGWNHRQRAVALATLYAHRKGEEGWKGERLAPMLAGLLELLPWLQQWHNEPDAEFDGAVPAKQFADFLEAECAEWGLTHDDLRAWRPEARVRAVRAPKAAARAESKADEGAEKPKRARKKKPTDGDST